MQGLIEIGNRKSISDSAWFVLKGKNPVTSWIGFPDYLPDELDPLDMVGRDARIPIWRPKRNRRKLASSSEDEELPLSR